MCVYFIHTTLPQKLDSIRLHMYSFQQQQQQPSKSKAKKITIELINLLVKNKDLKDNLLKKIGR